jgi:hypothetical protein
MTAIYQVDCMISGLVPFRSAYLILAYISPDTYTNEATEDRAEQRRKAANRPELRIIDKGEETSADALGISQFHLYGCNDYLLAASKRPGEEYFVVSPKDVVVVRPRDEADHVEWLVERERFEEALGAAEVMSRKHGAAVDVGMIGRKYMEHLVGLGRSIGGASGDVADPTGEYDRAAALAPRVLATNVAEWERWISLFDERDRLAVSCTPVSSQVESSREQAIVPYIPIDKPRLGKAVYGTIIDHLLINDRPVSSRSLANFMVRNELTPQALLKTINTWPAEIYDIRSVMSNVQSELDGAKSDPMLLEVVGEL